MSCFFPVLEGTEMLSPSMLSPWSWFQRGLVCYLLPEAPHCTLLQHQEATATFPRFFLLPVSNFLQLLLINMPESTFLPVWFCVVSGSWLYYHLEVCGSSQGKLLQRVDRIEDLDIFKKNTSDPNWLIFSVITSDFRNNATEQILLN